MPIPPEEIVRSRPRAAHEAHDIPRMDMLKISSPAQVAKTLLAALLTSMVLVLCAAHQAAAAANIGSFTADLSVSQPTLSSPADGAALAYPDDGIALRWTDVGGATKYELQIASLVAPNPTCSFANDVLI